MQSDRREIIARRLYHVMLIATMGNRPHLHSPHLAFDFLPNDMQSGWLAVAAETEKPIRYLLSSRGAA